MALKNNYILNTDERLVTVIRQSVLILIFKLTIPSIIIIVPFFFLYPLFNQGWWGIFIFVISVGIGLMLMAKKITIWSQQKLIITTKRLIDIDQKGIFQKIVSDIPLDKIQEIFYQIKGVVQTISRLGNLHIILSDGKSKIQIYNVSQPYKTQQLILDLKKDLTANDAISDKTDVDEFINLAKKVKTEIGQERFNEIINQLNNHKSS